ncbi:MAG TPA: CPBP family intramembrane glutamic endopeptidase [Steroidobacteraceae bacterium]|nr:CPBP family intramembrane glutamic endopeptidase [Steroidobacteraceae bacterium]
MQVSRISADGEIRWSLLLRALIYSVLAFWLLPTWLSPPVQALSKAWHLGGLTAGNTALFEALLFLIALLLTWTLGLYERRRVDEYGLPVRQAFGRQFWEGFALGVISAGAVAVGMLLLGGMRIHGLAIHGATLFWAALAWLGANLLVGLAEEYWFRGYLMQTLWKAVGFWPAAALIALWFAAAHYFFKAGENVWDVITLVSGSIWLCYTLRQTGSLWLAVGWHAAFDFMQFFVIGTPNGGASPARHLLDATFHGPRWLTGGALGTEASFLMYPLIALMFLYVWRRKFAWRADA